MTSARLSEAVGRIDGRTIEEFTLSAGPGLVARVMTYGARLSGLSVPDRRGRSEEVVLTLPTPADHAASDTYMGATCGRVGGRIAAGRFTLDGETHHLPPNEGPNHLHGGPVGFDRRIWEVVSAGDREVVLELRSPHGEMGYPGSLTARTTYRAEPDGLVIEMTAETDQPTVVNLMNHSYFNLGGPGAADILGHHLWLNAPFYTPLDPALLATGEVRRVTGTPFDFTTAKTVGRDIMETTPVPVAGRPDGGYDLNFCVAGQGMRPVAELYDPETGRRMRLASDQPGVQIYTSNVMREGLPSRDGRRLGRFAGITFETQALPDAPNFAHFPSAVLRPGETYRHRMVFSFSAD